MWAFFVVLPYPVIRDIAAVIADRRSVGIFPEGVRNWAGKTQPMDISIAKLIKLLNVPVIVAVMKGMNLMNPRWSPKLRRTRLMIEYKLLFKKSEVETKTVGEIYQMLTEAKKRFKRELVQPVAC